MGLALHEGIYGPGCCWPPSVDTALPTYRCPTALPAGSLELERCNEGNKCNGGQVSNAEWVVMSG